MQFGADVVIYMAGKKRLNSDSYNRLVFYTLYIKLLNINCHYVYT